MSLLEVVAAVVTVVWVVDVATQKRGISEPSDNVSSFVFPSSAG